MKFLVLGPMAAEGASGPLELGGPRQRSVLARLLIARGDVVSVDQLLDDLWSGVPPPRAVGSLQASVSNLRRTLEPARPPRSSARRLVSAAPGYALRMSEDEELDSVDAVTFERLVAEGSRLLAAGRPEEAGATLDAALALWRGDAYADFADEAWAVPEVARLAEWRLLAREHRRAAALAAEGAAEAIPAITIPSQRESSPTSEPVGSGSPIGRAAPLQSLLTAAGEALTGGIRVAVVSGESGIGKTFLVEAVSERLRTGGWRIAWGRCPEAEGVPALWPWQQAIAPLIAALPPSAELTGRLANLLGTEATPPAGSSDAAEARFRQHDAVARYLATATAKEPLLVVLDDLQWADSASLRLLLDLIALRRGGRILVIATLRSGEGGLEVDDALGRLGREGALRLALSGLEADAIAELTASLGFELDAAQVAQLAVRTAGNPFLLQESLKLAATVGNGIEALLAGVPPTVRDVLTRRLSRLPDEVRELLASAAVLGRDVAPDLLAAVTFVPEEQVFDALDLATVTGVLAENSQGGLQFAHDLVRETLEASLPPMRRTKVHARASDALESAAADPAAIAYHAIAAGPSESVRAARFAYAAGVSARQRLAFDDAADWFGKTIELAEAQPDPDWPNVVSLQLALVRVQLDGGDWIAARESRAAAIRAADLTDDPQLPLQALVALDAPAVWTQRCYAEVDLDIARRTERALAGLPKEDSDLRCRLLGALARELYDGSDDPRCDSLSRVAIEMARRLGDPRLLAFALTSRYQAVNQPRFAAELVAVGQELSELGAQEGMPAFELLGHEVTAMYLLQLFDVRGADAEAAASEPLLRRLSLRPASAIHRMWQAMRLLADGRLDEAEQVYEESLAEQRTLGFVGAEPLADVIRAVLNTTRQRWDATVEPSGALAFAGTLFAHSLRVWALAEAGRAEEARALIDAETPAIVHDWSELTLLVTAAQAAVAAGHAARMHWCYEQLLPYSGWLAVGGNSLVLGPVDYYLARLACRLGDAEAADQHRSRAETDCRAAGLLWWGERSQVLAEELRGAPTSGRQVVR